MNDAGIQTNGAESGIRRSLVTIRCHRCLHAVVTAKHQAHCSQTRAGRGDEGSHLEYRWEFGPISPLQSTVHISCLTYCGLINDTQAELSPFAVGWKTKHIHPFEHMLREIKAKGQMPPRRHTELSSTQDVHSCKWNQHTSPLGNLCGQTPTCILLLKRVREGLTVLILSQR